MVIVNTCAVTERTERKVLRRLRQLEGDRLLIGGCLAAAMPQSIQSLRCQGRLGPLKRGMPPGSLSSMLAGPCLRGISNQGISNRSISNSGISNQGNCRPRAPFSSRCHSIGALVHLFANPPPEKIAAA